MKKKYFAPESEWLWAEEENNFMASGEDLDDRDYGTDPGEDPDEFWY